MSTQAFKRRKRQRREDEAVAQSETEATVALTTTNVVYFQDLISPSHHPENVAEALFELANAPYVGYRLPPLLSSLTEKTEFIGSSVVVKQNNDCATHTGGIVWETSYLLASYLLQKKIALKRTLELGAGCGLLGLVLAAAKDVCSHVVLTETYAVMDQLKKNVDVWKNNYGVDNSGPPTRTNATACALCWNNLRMDIAKGDPHLARSSFDSIVGTDVIFTPALVRPLLQTMRSMAHDDTVIYLCLQVRCADSHTLFLEEARNIFGFEVEHIDLNDIPECQWGVELECILLRLTCLTDAKFQLDPLAIEISQTELVEHDDKAKGKKNKKSIKKSKKKKMQQNDEDDIFRSRKKKWKDEQHAK